MIQDATASPVLLQTDCSHQGQKGSSPFLANSESRDSLNTEFRFRTGVQPYTCTPFYK